MTEDYSNEMVFDRQSLLEQIGNDEDLLKEIISVFVIQFPESSGQLKSAIDNADFVQMKFHAHTLKGICGTMKLNKLQAISRKIEQMANEQADVAVILPYYDLLEPAYMEFDSLTK